MTTLMTRTIGTQKVKEVVVRRTVVDDTQWEIPLGTIKIELDGSWTARDDRGSILRQCETRDEALALVTQYNS